MQLPLGFLVPESNWELPSLSNLPSNWNNFSRIGIDTETKDPTLTTMGIGVRRGGYIVGVSISFEDGPKYYLPIKHASGKNLDHAQTLSYIRDNARTYTGIIVGANLQYDLDYLAEHGITFPVVKWFRDVLVIDAIINELELRYSLEAVGQRRTGVGKDESLLFEAAKAYGARTKSDVKKLIWAMPPEISGPYAEQDAFLPLKILREQEKIIEEQELWPVTNLESQVLPVCLKMRRRGIQINEDKVAQIEQWSLNKEAEILKEVRRLTGFNIPVGDTMKADVVAEAFKAVGIIPPRTDKDKISIDKEWLATVKHPTGALVREARQMAQLRSTFVDPVKEHVINGRVHCTFNQLRSTKEGNEEGKTQGTITGRLSSTDFNIQQQIGEAQGELGERWRDIYEPNNGAIFGSKDYSQQEPRWLVHWAVLAGPRRIGEAAHKAALHFAERYCNDPTMDFHAMTAGIAQINRKPAKIVGLARIYGRGGASLCHQLELPTIMVEKKWGGEKHMMEEAGPEGQAIMDKFDRGAPFAQAMLKADADQAKSCMYIRTHILRRLHFEINKWGNVDEPHKALNKRIQGSSADQTKIAMVELDRAGYYIQLQAHDEICGSYSTPAEVKAAAEIMENCVKMKVPSKVDIATGTSWGECLKSK